MLIVSMLIISQLAPVVAMIRRELFKHINTFVHCGPFYCRVIMLGKLEFAGLHDLLQLGQCAIRQRFIVRHSRRLIA